MIKVEVSKKGTDVICAGNPLEILFETLSIVNGIYKSLISKIPEEEYEDIKGFIDFAIVSSVEKIINNEFEKAIEEARKKAEAKK